MLGLDIPKAVVMLPPKFDVQEYLFVVHIDVERVKDPLTEGFKEF